MPFYLYQVAYTQATARTLVDDPQDREQMARTAIELLGGKLHSFHFAFGEYDVVMIAEMPDNIAAGALSLGGASRGAFSKLHTTPLLTTAEGVAVMKKAREVPDATSR